MKRPDPSRDLRTMGGLLIAAGSLWYSLLMRPLWQAVALGPICRHSGLAHCPACYAALAMAALGLWLSGFAAANRGPALAAVPVARSRRPDAR